MGKSIFLVATLCLLPATLYCGELIKQIDIRQNKLSITINDAFKKKFLLDDFFAEYDEDINLEELPESIVTLPFILIIFSTVWASGETYYIESLDSRVYRGLEKLKKMYELLYPKTEWKGELIPRKLVNTPRPEKTYDPNTHVALLFSGGLDSTVTSLYHSDKKQLLITAWGQWDFPLNKPELWNTVKKRFIEYAQEYEFENTFIRSNYSEIFNHDVLEALSPEIPRWRIYTIEDIGWVGLTAPILYAKGYKTLKIASSDTWDFGYPSAAGPFIDSTMKFAGLRFDHDLYDYSRLDKIEFLAKFCKKKTVTKPYLTVCQQGMVDNCANCSKCLATIMGLYAVGEDPSDYGFEAPLNSLQPAINDQLKYPVKSLTKIERYTHIQDRVKQRLKKGDRTAKAMAWILDFDLSDSFPYTFEAQFQQPMPWTKLSEILPRIEVPEKCKNPYRDHAMAPINKKDPSEKVPA